MSGYDYGRAGIFAVATPQANPTVEAELRILMPGDTLVCAARCISASGDPATRLVDYIEEMAGTFARFDTIIPAAAGFACTGSSYLVGAAREAQSVRAAEAVISAPVITATRAIADALAVMNVRRLILAAPYPAPLLDAACAYWSAEGVEIVRVVPIRTSGADTRSIYALSSQDAALSLAGADLSGADAVLLSGTGMPTLGALRARGALAFISSNLCLAWSLLRAAGDRRAGEHHGAMTTGWQKRLHGNVDDGECL